MRTAKIKRRTKETDVRLEISLDGGQVNISTGIAFFDHMLIAFAMHSNIGLQLSCKGDLDVDSHHSVEDVGICLGLAMKKALSDSILTRYGNFTIPMDESLASSCLDISGRSFLVFNADFSNSHIGNFDTSMTEEFFRALAFNAGITLHINLVYGKNDHHKIEAIFKSFAHAFKQAIVPIEEVLSTKGSLD